MKRYRLLGNSGLRVSPLCLGSMNFGSRWPSVGKCDNPDEILDAFVEAGGNFIDTANNYHDGETENILGAWMAKRGNRERLVIATKFTSNNSEGAKMRLQDPNAVGISRKNLFDTLHSSLKRLQTHYIDVLYVHWWDHVGNLEEMMRGLNDVVASGKVHYIAVSDWPAWLVVKANGIAERHGWPQFIVYQGRYSLLDRAMEREVIPMVLHEKMAICPWGVNAQGKLSRTTITRDAPKEDRVLRGGFAVLTDRDFDVRDVVTKIATELGASNTQVAIAWQLHQPRIVPIVGFRTMGQLQDSLKALTLTLTPEHMKALDEASAIERGFPTDFIGRSVNECRWLSFGGENEKIKVVPW